MTLKGFWSSKERLAIHCKTEEQAKIFCEASDKLDKTWCTKESYLDQNNWNEYKSKTCYSNNGEYCSEFWYQEHNYKIINFEDINFNPILITQIKYIAVKDNTVLTLAGFKPLNTVAQIKLYPAPCTAKADLEKIYGTYEGVKFIKVKVSIYEV